MTPTHMCCHSLSSHQRDCQGDCRGQQAARRIISRVVLILMPCPRFPAAAALFPQSAAASKAQPSAKWT